MGNQPPVNELRAFTSEEQDPDTVKSVLAKVQQILTSNETIQYIAIQKKPVVNIKPDCVVLTNRRFIVYRPQILGRISFEDHVWRDLQDAKLQENILGSTITMNSVTGQLLTVDWLPKVQARRVYAFAQEMEERVREERRGRDLEEKRAASGGVFVSGTNPGAAPGALQGDAAQRLKALKEMFDAGLITAGEYEGKRAEIISKM